MKIRHISMTAIGVASVIVLYGMNSQSPSNCPLAQRNLRAAEDSGKHLDVRFAQTYLKLAKVELKKALEANEKSSAAYSAALVERLRQNVKTAEEQLQQARMESQGDVHKVHLRDAEAAVAIAELRLTQAQAMNERLAGSYDQTELERLRLTVEVARLRLEKARDPARVSSPNAHLKWQLEQLRDEVLELHIRLEKELLRR